MDPEQFNKIRKRVMKTTGGRVESSDDGTKEAMILRLDLVITPKGVGMSMGLNDAIDSPMKLLLGEEIWSAWVEETMVALGRDRIIAAALKDLDRHMLLAFKRKEKE